MQNLYLTHFMPLLHCVIIKLIIKYFPGHQILSLQLHVIYLSSFLLACFKLPSVFRLSPLDQIISGVFLLVQMAQQLQHNLFICQISFSLGLVFVSLYIIGII